MNPADINILGHLTKSLKVFQNPKHHVTCNGCIAVVPSFSRSSAICKGIIIIIVFIKTTTSKQNDMHGPGTRGLETCLTPKGRPTCELRDTSTEICCNARRVSHPRHLCNVRHNQLHIHQPSGCQTTHLWVPVTLLGSCCRPCVCACVHTLTPLLKI